MSQLRKPELIAEIVKKTGVTAKVATAVVEAMVDTLHAEVAQGRSASIPGIGCILPRERPARMVRNPANGERVRRDADRHVRIAVSRTLKRAANTPAHS